MKSTANRIERIAAQPQVSRVLDLMEDRLEALLVLTGEIQQIPSPTFSEGLKAAYVEERFLDLGLDNIHQDELHNVYARLPRAGQSGGRPLVISAHIDTVFPEATKLSSKREGGRLYGPSVADNSAGVAGLIMLAEILCEEAFGLSSEVNFVANVCEEGLGDLRGMRAVVEHFGEEPRYIIIEGGLFGQLSHEAIGVQRFRIDITGPGGHSWGSFGMPSAIHVMGQLIADLGQLDYSVSPKTTYNVGMVEGGTSINTIAASASLWLDLRSEDSKSLRDLVGRVSAIVDRTNRLHDSDGSSIHLEMVEVGNRPPGRIPRNTPLVQWAAQALKVAGHKSAHYLASSTDANIPLSRGYEAICLGLTESIHSHRTDENLDITFLSAGMNQLLLVTLAAAGEL